MLTKLMRKIYKDQKGITGLETAIILIAFVVVAAVFAYTVLSAGLFASEKSSEAVYSGLQQTQSTLEMRGGITAYASNTGDAHETAAEDVHTSADGEITVGACVTRLQFTVANVLGGEPVDLTPNYTATTVDSPSTLAASGYNDKTVISFRDQYNIFPECAWTIDWIGQASQDNLLQPGEKAMITVWLIDHPDANEFHLNAAANSAFFTDADAVASRLVDINHQFTLEIKSQQGAVLTLERTTPAFLDAVMDLQ
ncbi:MAG: hypothetical protein PHV74_03220 [Dehalococcoidia bacterium]|nr:hypothetical protein [Dehalococcoidia bacterium]